MKFKLLASILALGILSGCSTIENAYLSAESKYENYKFNYQVKSSQILILEARAYLLEGDYEKAKSYLDQAFVKYSKQASLHAAYKDFYETLGNTKFC